ncbi:DUF397 domain-containing protein [Kitasatospora viridis]|uniref:Uncharacterized protein DUF397 n=1 Tax=Kitasatospora viridis TaxID=281105 RepID=A0A561UHA1_9ACTN|nr:DUF397 domain-containing protein [Kitasatospora viridis]TWF98734.1 uncharacterized protein DUF397 [Kitasatospora viridis]
MASSSWQRSSYTGSSNDCVEVRTTDDGMVELRESDDGEVIVRTTPIKFAKFLQGVKDGEFDHFADPAS